MTRLVILKTAKFYICQKLMGALQMFRDDRLSSQRKAQKYVVENADPGAEPAVGTDMRFVESDTELMTNLG